MRCETQHTINTAILENLLSTWNHDEDFDTRLAGGGGTSDLQVSYSDTPLIYVQHGGHLTVRIAIRSVEGSALRLRSQK